jgi:hypothetical protein
VDRGVCAAEGPQVCRRAERELTGSGLSVNQFLFSDRSASTRRIRDKTGRGTRAASPGAHRSARAGRADSAQQQPLGGLASNAHEWYTGAPATTDKRQQRVTAVLVQHSPWPCRRGFSSAPAAHAAASTATHWAAKPLTSSPACGPASTRTRAARAQPRVELKRHARVPLGLNRNSGFRPQTFAPMHAPTCTPIWPKVMVTNRPTW